MVLVVINLEDIVSLSEMCCLLKTHVSDQQVASYMYNCTQLTEAIAMMLSVSVSLCLSVCLSVCLSACLCLCLSLSLSLSLSVCLSVCLCLCLPPPFLPPSLPPRTSFHFHLLLCFFSSFLTIPCYYNSLSLFYNPSA